MPSTASRRRWSRSTCARTVSWRRRTDLNSLLFLLTPGVEASKAGTLVSGLVAFKKLHDENALLGGGIPEFFQRRQRRYAGVRLARSLRRHAPLLPRRQGVSPCRPSSSRPSTCPISAMSPARRRALLVRNEVDYLPIDRIAGRIATTPFVVYPPGIATGRAGRAADRAGQPMIDYLKMFETCFNTFPASTSRSRASIAR
jgi:ornithine decarboxylase/arginine decarboxylase